MFSCQNYTLPVTEQFTAPSRSVVGLYSNRGVSRPLLLYTNNNTQQITTQEVARNQSSIMSSGNDDVDYNVAIRLHLGKLLHPVIRSVILSYAYLPVNLIGSV